MLTSSLRPCVSSAMTHCCITTEMLPPTCCRCSRNGQPNTTFCTECSAKQAAHSVSARHQHCVDINNTSGYKQSQTLQLSNKQSDQKQHTGDYSWAEVI